MELNTDWNEFLNLLESSGVEYLVVGAFALARYGEPRQTGDIDIWIRADRANADKVIECLAKFGFGSLGLKRADFVEPDVVIQLGFPPRRIDLLTKLTGLSFESAWAKRERGPLGNLEVNYLSKEDFVANKRATGRPKDLADIDGLP